MKGLLGFAVLTGPLWLIILLLIFGIWLAFKVAKRFSSTPAKLAVGLGIVALVLIVPFGDEIAGRVYLNYLCATKAGVKVYHTVELPAEYWDERGRPKFYANWDAHLGKTYPLEYKHGVYSWLFNIENAGHEFVDARSGQVLGVVVDFRYWGGWIRTNLSPHNSAIGCVNYTEPSNRLIDRIFKPEHPSTK